MPTSLTTILDELKSTLAGTTAFQSFVDADDADDAAAFIHLHAIQAPARPFCLLTLDSRIELRMVEQNDDDPSRLLPTIRARFEQSEAGELSSAALGTFIDDIESVMRAWLIANRTATAPTIRSAASDRPPVASHPAESPSSGRMLQWSWQLHVTEER